MIKRMVLENINGLMVEDTLEIGKMESNMEKEFTFQLKGLREKDSGMKEKD